MIIRKHLAFLVAAFCLSASSGSALAREKAFRCAKTEAWYSYRYPYNKDQPISMTPGVVVLSPEKKTATISGQSVFLANTPDRYILSARNDSDDRVIFSILKRDYSYSWFSLSEVNGNVFSIGSASGKCRPI